ncbi:MAG: hypothetical protein ACI4T8_02010 [Christensenellales bacterium]
MEDKITSAYEEFNSLGGYAVIEVDDEYNRCGVSYFNCAHKLCYHGVMGNLATTLIRSGLASPYTDDIRGFKAGSVQNIKKFKTLTHNLEHIMLRGYVKTVIVKKMEDGYEALGVLKNGERTIVHKNAVADCLYSIYNNASFWALGREEEEKF